MPDFLPAGVSGGVVCQTDVVAHPETVARRFAGHPRQYRVPTLPSANLVTGVAAILRQGATKNAALPQRK